MRVAPRGPRAIRGALFALGLTAAACAGGGSGSGGASISIEKPSDGARVTSPVQLTLSASGVKIGPPDTGDMHFHVHVVGVDVCKPVGYCVVTSTHASVPVPQGEHTIRVVLAEPNHDETDVTASVTVTVSGATVTGASGSGGSGGSGGYGRGYG